MHGLRIHTAASALLFSVAAVAQDEASRALYEEHCATCHAASLRGSAHGASLTGIAFDEKWGPLPAQALFDYLRTQMPPGQAASLSNEQHAAIARCYGGGFETTDAYLVHELVEGETLGTCTVTALDKKRKRATFVVKNTEPRPYTCFATDDLVQDIFD